VQLYLHADDLARLDGWAEDHGIINERGEYSRSEAVAYLIRRLPQRLETVGKLPPAKGKGGQAPR
jgi:hypothetical protein